MRVCFIFVNYRGRKKTRHKHPDNAATANNQQQQGNVNQGYTQESSNTNHTTVAVISNGRQYPSPNRSNEKPLGGSDAQENHRQSPADSGISGIGVVDDYHDGYHGNGMSGDHAIVPKDHAIVPEDNHEVKSSRKDSASDLKPDGCGENKEDGAVDEDAEDVVSHNGSFTSSHHSKATYTAGSDHGMQDDEIDQSAEDTGVDNNEEEEEQEEREQVEDEDENEVEPGDEKMTVHDTRTANKSVVVPDISESGYTSDYFALK